MPYFHEDLIQNNRLLVDAVILTETGETISQRGVGAKSFLPNYAVRAIVQDLQEAHGDNIPTIRRNHAPAHTLADNALINFQCPITLSVMEDPVVAADGHSYERVVIENWFRQFSAAARPRSPKTNEFLENTDLVPNRMLQKFIQDIQSQRQAHQLPPLPLGMGALTANEILATFIHRQKERFAKLVAFFGAGFQLSTLGVMLTAHSEVKAGAAAGTLGTSAVVSTPLGFASSAGVASSEASTSSSAMYRARRGAAPVQDVDSSDDEDGEAAGAAAPRSPRSAAKR